MDARHVDIDTGWMDIYMDPRQVYIDNGQLDNGLYAGRRPATDMYVQQGCRYGT